MIKLKKELLIFLVLFVISSLIFHWSSWMSNPLSHLEALFSSPMPYHPLLYVFLIYIVILIFRMIIALIKKLLSRK